MNECTENEGLNHDRGTQRQVPRGCQSSRRGQLAGYLVASLVAVDPLTPDMQAPACQPSVCKLEKRKEEGRSKKKQQHKSAGKEAGGKLEARTGSKVDPTSPRDKLPGR